MDLLYEFELEVDHQTKEKEQVDKNHKQTIFNLQKDLIELKQKSKKALRELKANMQKQVNSLKLTYLKQYSIEDSTLEEDS